MENKQLADILAKLEVLSERLEHVRGEVADVRGEVAERFEHARGEVADVPKALSMCAGK